MKLQFLKKMLYFSIYRNFSGGNCSLKLSDMLYLFEPRREKTGLRGFRPGPTQTGLYKLRKELEACDFGFK